MSRRILFQRSIFVSLGLGLAGAAWWGCSATPETSSSTGGSTSSSTGGGGTMSTGGIDTNFDGGGGEEDSGTCTSLSAAAERVSLDILFVIDRSMSMSEGMKWPGTKNALTTFWNDPASAKIGAGIVYFPNDYPKPCIPEDYQNLAVPIAPLPANAFNLINSMPENATGQSTPTYGALKGALQVATAYKDAHPKHKVIVVLATDGGPNACGSTTIDDIAALAKSARNYNGVLTYVIAVNGADVNSINKIAVGGGTGATYDVTNDINEFAAKMEDIRGAQLGCEFEIPLPPNGMDVDPDKVNFSYTPQGMGEAKIILRADDLADCNDKPGWYYDSNSSPSKIILCPASCTTVQADTSAKVEVLFGCKSQIN